MVYKEKIRWEHLEAYQAGRYEEIPVELMEEVAERVSRLVVVSEVGVAEKVEDMEPVDE